MKLFFVALIILMAAVCGAQPQANASPLKSKARIKRPPSDISKDWSVSVGYKVGTDLQKSGEQRIFTHKLSSEFSYQLNHAFSLSTGTALAWKAEGQNVSKEQDNPAWDDLSASVGYSDAIGSVAKYSVTVGNDFPTGNDSRNEGIKNTLGSSAVLSSSFFDKTLSLSGTLSASKLFHSYDLSIVSGESNVDTIAGFSAFIAYQVFEATKVSLSHSFTSYRQINGESQAKNSSSVAISYKYKQARFGFEHNLGNYEKSDGYQFLFVDEYKRIYRLGVLFEI